MNVGDLKKKLATLPDYCPIIIALDDDHLIECKHITVDSVEYGFKGYVYSSSREFNDENMTGIVLYAK